MTKIESNEIASGNRSTISSRYAMLACKEVHQLKGHQVIGQGEFGQVKLAHNTETGQDVAIKVVPKSNYKSE